MAVRPDKLALLDELIALLTTDLEVAARVERTAREAATHEESKPENDKDTRALEQSYLARGQSMRVDDLQTGLAQTRAIRERAQTGGPAALGSLVEADEDGETVFFLLAPARGGTKLGDVVQVLTPSSPLGRAFLGKRAGDELEAKVAKGTRTFEIIRVD